MKTQDFVDMFYGDAKKSQDETGISAIAILAQAALESGWGDHAPGFEFFGVKSFSKDHSADQLMTTCDFSRRADLQFPQIISVTPTTINGQKFFKYVVKDWFKKYNSAEAAFTDHSNFFLNNPRYGQALEVRSDPMAFLQAISDAGYATAPGYAVLIKKIASMISNLIPA